jgi:HlyD family secretion protein
MTPQLTLFPDTRRQDRPLRAPGRWRRWRSLAAVILIGALGSGFLGLTLLRLAGTVGSINRSRLSFATVEHGAFVKDVAAEGQVIAAVSPTLYAGSAGTVCADPSSSRMAAMSTSSMATWPSAIRSGSAP